MSGSVTLDERDFDRVLAAHDGIVVVDFWARWCRPCKTMAPLVARIAADAPVRSVARRALDG